MNIYCFSGLGADERVFQKLEIPSAKLHFINWIPWLPEENLPEYALRLGSTVNFKKPFCLMGVSFGGMIALELSKGLSPVQTFLISSAVDSCEINRFIRLLGKTRIYKLLPDSLFRHTSFAVYSFFGLKERQEKLLFRQILLDTDIPLMKWAMGAILAWRPTQIPPVIRIHGNRDRIIPLRNQTVDHIIERGTHFCVLQQAARINQIIASYLS